MLNANEVRITDAEREVARLTAALGEVRFLLSDETRANLSAGSVAAGESMDAKRVRLALVLVNKALGTAAVVNPDYGNVSGEGDSEAERVKGFFTRPQPSHKSSLYSAGDTGNDSEIVADYFTPPTGADFFADVYDGEPFEPIIDVLWEGNDDGSK